MGGVQSTAFTREALAAAWQGILDNDLADSSLSQGVQRFSEDADARLDRLAESLAPPDTGGLPPFEAGQLTQVEIAIGGKVRTLHIPTVGDRVVARALLTWATPLVDPYLGPSAFAYRPGLGVADAVQALAAWRDEGLTWVARTDIDDCFPSVPVEVAFRRFDALVADPEASRIVRAFLDRTFWHDGRLRRVPGLPQGCPLSPLLTNLTLVDVDDAVSEAGFPVVRYGDDLLRQSRKPRHRRRCESSMRQQRSWECHWGRTRPW